MELTLSQLLITALGRYHGRLAAHAAGRSWTYRELDEQSDALASGLRKAGIEKGQAVALYLRNCVEYVISDLALLKLGAIKVPLNEYQSQGDVSYILRDTGALAMIAHQSLINQLSADPMGEGLQLLLSVPDTGESNSRIKARQWVEFLQPGTFAPAMTDPEDTAMIAYTGGTTGRPKGVVQTQKSLAVNLFAHIVAGEITASDVMMLVTPLPHSAGYHLQACLLQGGQVVLANHFDPATCCEDIQLFGVTWIFLVPTMIYRLLDQADLASYNHQSIRTIVYGAAPISASRLVKAIEYWGRCFIQLYGQTECPNFITALTKEDHGNADLLGSCGKAVPFVELATTALNGEGSGEIIVRSPYLFKEYHRNPDVTAETLRDGWLQTGDIGFIDENGYLFLQDRAKDMIITGGMNVYSTEVEHVLKAHPAVVDAAVVGLPDEDWGERVHAVVVPREQVEAQVLLDLCRETLSRYKVPKSIEFLELLPLTAYGKVDKKLLRDTCQTQLK